MSSPRKVLRSQENFSAGHVVAPVAAAAAAKAAVGDLTEEAKVSPPQPPRSAFMCFSDAKYKEIAEQEGDQKVKSEMIQLVADAWKALSDQERAYWDEEARNDKLRYVREKAAYKGPWEIPKRRAKKHPLAPKRPMSAFLKYSQTRRSIVKKENPDMSNTDVSRLLGEMWRGASPEEKAPYVEQEERERAIYKKNIAQWRAEQHRLDAASRTSHQIVTSSAVEHPHHGRHDTQASVVARAPSQEETGALHHEYRLSASAETYQVPYPSFSNYLGYSSVLPPTRPTYIQGHEAVALSASRSYSPPNVPTVSSSHSESESAPVPHAGHSFEHAAVNYYPPVRRQLSGEENTASARWRYHHVGGNTYYPRYY